MTSAQVVSAVKAALSVVVMCAVWVWLFWTQLQPLFAAEEDADGDGDLDPLEALHWLRTCPEGGGLSPQRFRHPGEATAFVGRLYRLAPPPCLSRRCGRGAGPAGS
jgi:hypothetical protein